MNFDEEVAKFFAGFSEYQYDRKAIEADPFFQKAIKEQNVINAQTRALELMPAYENVKNKRANAFQNEEAQPGRF